MSDLVVERIWLDARNKIAFKVKNTSKGGISQDAHAQGMVKVTYGDSHRDYPLRQIDPGRALARGGGVVSFTTDIVLASPAQVVVEVDYTQKIPEAREDNNKLTASLAPRTAILEQVKQVETPARDMTPARGIGEPQVGIERVYLKDGRVHVLLKNSGQSLSRDDLKQITLNLQVGGKANTWRLSKIDPQLRLGQKEGTLDFDTGIATPEGADIKAYTKGINWQLSSITAVGIPKRMEGLDVGRQQPPDGIDRMPPLQFVYPRRGEKLARGTNYMISCYYNSDTPATATFFLKREGTSNDYEIPNAHNLVVNPGQNSFSWFVYIPTPYPPTGTKYRIIAKSGETILGMSEEFEILTDVDLRNTIRFLSPQPGDRLVKGCDNEISWLFSSDRGTNALTAHILLMKGGAPLYSFSDAIRIDSYHKTYKWRIPSYCPEGSDFKIRLVSSDIILGESGVFQISQTQLPDFAIENSWYQSDKRACVLIKNIGAPFEGRVYAYIDPAVMGRPGFGRYFEFPPSNPFSPGQRIPICSEPFDWPGKDCSIDVIAEVNPWRGNGHEVEEIDYENNVQQFKTFRTAWPRPMIGDYLEFSTGNIHVSHHREGTNNAYTFHSRNDVTMATQDTILLDIKYKITNCSQEVNTYHLVISYMGEGNRFQEDSQNISLAPGEERSFTQSIKLYARGVQNVKIQAIPIPWHLMQEKIFFFIFNF